jgi:hypothetical protein
MEDSDSRSLVVRVVEYFVLLSVALGVPPVADVADALEAVVVES